MQDFIRFLRHLLKMAYFIRGILSVFILLLLLCVIIVVRTEELTIGQAVYFVSITTLSIGYGDITPVTAWGRFASVTAGIVGLLLNGIVIAVAVRALALAVHEKREKKSQS